MTVSLIAAHDPNLVIGKDGTLPWHYKEDLAYFKRTTMGKPVVMGRGVFEEIGERPLPGRKNIVLTKTRFYPGIDVTVCRSLSEAYSNLKGEEKVFIIGGSEIYEQTIDHADELYITLIKKTYEGDTWFPEYRDKISSVWREVWKEELDDISFHLYRRS